MNNLYILPANATQEEAQEHIQKMHVKWAIESLNKVSSGVLGIEKVLNTILVAEEQSCDWPLRDSGFVKGALHNALSIMAEFMDIQLDTLKKLNKK